jgi:hypothetical protein
MRDGDWKFLCMTDGSAPELYDLATDEGEKHNLASTQPERVAAMKKQLLNWNASMPKDHSTPRISRPDAKPKVNG